MLFENLLRKNLIFLGMLLKIKSSFAHNCGVELGANVTP
jgi:hypothetical protein